MIAMYWDLGRQVVERQKRGRWGMNIIEQAARDLRAEFPRMLGLSASNIWRMRAFYLAWADGDAFLARPVRELGAPIRQRPIGKSTDSILPRPVAELPWGHTPLDPSRIEKATMPVMSAIAAFLAADHDRLDALLSRAAEDPQAYESFRRGLLKHVGMEEMILLPAAKRLSGAPASLAAKIRRDHGALTALMILTPTPAVLAAVGDEAPRILDALKNAPDIPPAPHVDTPQALASVRRALEAAGFGPLV